MNKSLRLLLVEDSGDDAEMLIYHLKQSTPELIAERVETAEAMQRAFDDQTWDLVISDYNLPRFSAEEALKIVQDKALDIPFIVVSGAIGEENAVQIMRSGAHDYVMKRDMKRLIPAIERELREAQARRNYRASQEAHHRSEAQLRALLDATTDIAFLMSVDGVFLTMNRMMATSLGRSVEELIGQNGLEIMRDPIRKVRLPYFEQVRHTGLPARWQDSTIPDENKPNQVSFWDNSIYPIMSIDGKVEAFAVYSRNITEEKKLEIELQRYNTQLETLVEERTLELRLAKEEIELILNNTTDAIALAQSNGDIRAQNPSFTAIFGEQRLKNIEGILWTFGNQHDVSSVSNALISMLSKHERQRVEAQVRYGEDDQRDIDLCFIPVHLGDKHNSDERPAILVTAHDITPLKEMERFKERFVADAIHDLATPISGLSTRIYLLKRSPEKLVEHLQALENQVSYLRNLLDDLRTLSQFDREEFSLELQAQNLNDMVKRVFDTYEPVAIEKRQILTLNLDLRLPTIMLDVRRMERVFFNLVANAVNYTPGDKQIHLRTIYQADTVIFSVIDEGIGISAEDLAHIFERFYRSKEVRKNQTGTGLGLAITKEVVEMHGGTVSAQSELGKGSAFTIRLPLNTSSKKP